MGKKSGVHYVDNKKLYAEMVKFIAAYRESKQKGKLGAFLMLKLLYRG